MKVLIGCLIVILLLVMMVMLLIVCGGSSNKMFEEEIIIEGEIYGFYSIGFISEFVMVYFDLDIQSIVELIDEEVVIDMIWDIVFCCIKVWLNMVQEMFVSVYFIGNNVDFYDVDGNFIVDMFIIVIVDLELDDYMVIMLVDVLEVDVFSGDEVVVVVGISFYNYDMIIYVVIVVDDVYYIVYFDSNYIKFWVIDI